MEANYRDKRVGEGGEGSSFSFIPIEHRHGNWMRGSDEVEL